MVDKFRKVKHTGVIILEGIVGILDGGADGTGGGGDGEGGGRA